MPMFVRFAPLPIPKNPVLRALLAVAGIAIGVALLVVFTTVGLALLVLGAAAIGLRSLFGGRPAASSAGATKRPPPPGVIEGEFRVIETEHERERERASRR